MKSSGNALLCERIKHEGQIAGSVLTTGTERLRIEGCGNPEKNMKQI